MFPLEVPLRFLRGRAKGSQVVFDPFCGRGTTLYAARSQRMRAVGIDCSPVAVAISKAKLANAAVEEAIELSTRILATVEPQHVPQGDFWRCAYHEVTLHELCRLREGLMGCHDDDATVLLRAAILGILHGPKTKVGSYLSNQMQRTFAPKPAYAMKFWSERRLKAARIDTKAALERKLRRIGYPSYPQPSGGWGDVYLGDSSKPETYAALPPQIDAVVTSPPYYGMRTYVPDQWLRHWFLGGLAEVDYGYGGDLPSSSAAEFTESLAQTWSNIAARSANRLQMLVRFGSIPSRAVDARAIMLRSLDLSQANWNVVSIRNARTACEGKRQAAHMGRSGKPIDEFDLYAVLA